VKSEAQPAWTEQPLPSTPPWGVVEHATELLIGRAEVRWPEIRSLLEPYLGLGSPAGPSIAASGRFDLPSHGPYLRQMVRELARKVDPPESLVAAIEDAAEQEVVGAAQVGELWRGLGRSNSRLHPETVLRIGELFGVDVPWQVRTDLSWPQAVVVHEQHVPGFRNTVKFFGRELRRRRLVGLDELDRLLPGYPEPARRGLVHAMGWRAPDGVHAIDSRPANIDHGLGRALASVDGRPLTTEVLWDSLQRWSRDALRPLDGWDVDRLEQYLSLSPLVTPAKWLGRCRRLDHGHRGGPPRVEGARGQRVGHRVMVRARRRPAEDRDDEERRRSRDDDEPGPSSRREGIYCGLDT
jgi:hypothetical protein